MGVRRRRSILAIALVGAVVLPATAALAHPAGKDGTTRTQVVKRRFEAARKKIAERTAADEAASLKSETEARGASIRRLEEKAAAFASNIPDAEAASTLLDLGLLYEQGARAEEAIAIYRRLRASPAAATLLPKVTTRLATTLESAGRAEEALLLWRSLACRDRTARDRSLTGCRAIEGVADSDLAQAWVHIGDGESGGNLARAEEAYAHAVEITDARVRASALYKLARASLGLGHYAQAGKRLTELLGGLDPEAAPGSDLQGEALTLLARTIVQAADSPRAARKGGTIVERARVASLYPEDARWTLELYRELIIVLTEAHRDRDVADVGEHMLASWPADCRRAETQYRVALAFDALARAAKPGSADAADLEAKSVAEFLGLADDVGGGTGWVRTCKDDAEDIARAERLVASGLRLVAANATNDGRAVTNAALQQSDKKERDRQLERALGPFDRAAKTWRRYLALDETASDAPESRYWLADALHMKVVLSVAMDRSPSDDDLRVANEAAVDARDHAGSGTYLQPAAWFVVDNAYQRLLDEYKRYKATGGTAGAAKRESLEIADQGTDKEHVVRNAIPVAFLSFIAARQSYIDHVPRTADINVPSGEGTAPQALLFALDIGRDYLAYGELGQAKERLLPLMTADCRNNEIGFKAWESLFTIASLQNNVEEARRLAQQPCTGGLGPGPDPEPGGPRGGSYTEAWRKYQEAESLKDGDPRKKKLFLESATIYKLALSKFPEREEAAEAGIIGGLAFSRAGQMVEAADTLRFFLREHGKTELLDSLEHGNETARKQYEKRLLNLHDGEDRLARILLLSFDYEGAAAVFDSVSRNRRYKPDDRRVAAHNAVILYGNLGAPDKAIDAKAAYVAAGGSKEQKAEVDYLDADSSWKRREERVAEDVTSKTDAWKKAVGDFRAFYRRYETTRGVAVPYVLWAAYRLSRLHRQVGDTDSSARWCKATVAAFDVLQHDADKRDRDLSDFAATCAYELVDAEISRDFDARKRPDTAKDLKAANERWAPKLQKIIDRYGSLGATVAARARQGRLYDSIREKLSNGDALTDEVDAAMIPRYVEAVMWARSLRIESERVQQAAARLAHYTAIIGNPRMRTLARVIADPRSKTPFVYSDDIFVATQPGRLPALEPDGLALPLPVVP